MNETIWVRLGRGKDVPINELDIHTRYYHSTGRWCTWVYGPSAFEVGRVQEIEGYGNTPEESMKALMDEVCKCVVPKPELVKGETYD